MIKKYVDVLDEELIKGIKNYYTSLLDKDVWGSNICWEKRLSLISTNILTHAIHNKFLLNEIKHSVEKKLNVSFDSLNLDFSPSIYIWSGGSYITWHSDKDYPYNGTIYLNEEWDSSDGGIFLYRDNKNGEIKGIDPKYNSMVVNYSDHNPHCVTCIIPGTTKKRITIQWRTNPKNKSLLSYQ